MATQTGRIERLVSTRGFGFIAADDGTVYFFHMSAVHGVRFEELREGESVTFEEGTDTKGARAENVRVA